MQSVKRVRSEGPGPGLQPRHAQPWTLVLMVPWMDVWALGRLSQCSRWFHGRTWPTLRDELLFRCLGIPRQVTDKWAHAQLVTYQRMAGYFKTSFGLTSRYHAAMNQLRIQLRNAPLAEFTMAVNALTMLNKQKAEEMIAASETWIHRSQRLGGLLRNTGRPSREHAGECRGQNASCESCTVAWSASRNLAACPVFDASVCFPWCGLTGAPAPQRPASPDWQR